MRNTFIARWLAGCALAAASLVAHAQYSKVIAFGDSMTDVENYSKLAKALTGITSPPPPNMGGRFCNGLVAAEVLAQELGVPIENHAFAAATTGTQLLLPVAPLGMMTQVRSYIAGRALQLKGAERDALYFIWGGPDDFYALFGTGALLAPITVPGAVENLRTEIVLLYNAGARHFLVPLMPDLSVTPSAFAHEAKDPGYIVRMRKITDDFHAAMIKMLGELRVKYPKMNLRSFDTLTYLRTEMPLAAARGVNVTDACRPGGLSADGFLQPNTQACPDPDNYLFWDDNHPTAKANEMLGKQFAQAVR